MISPSKQKGTILIVALMVFVLIEVTLVILLERHSFEIMHAQDLQNYHQKTQTLLGGEVQAMAAMKEVLGQKPQAVIQLTPVMTSLGELTIAIVDLQAKLNINNALFGLKYAYPNFLATLFEDNFEQSAQLEKLLTLNPAQRRLITTPQRSNQDGYMQNAISSHRKGQIATETKTESEAESEANLETEPPIEDLRKSIMAQVNTLKTYDSLTELLEEGAIDAQGVSTLIPYACALKEPTAINVNSASAEVLMSLSTKMTKELANLIITERDKLNKGFESLDQITSNPAFKELGLASNLMTLQSNFYRVEISLIEDDQVVKLYTWMKVTPEDNYINIQVLSRSFGAL